MMTWAKKYHSKQEQYWPEIESFFSHLPPPLFQQGVLLKNNLAIAYSKTGRFADILRQDVDLPLLCLHFWLLDDWQISPTPERLNLEKQLFLTMFFTFAAIETRKHLQRESSTFDSTYLALSELLIRQADLHLACLRPGPASFWEHVRQIWQEQAAAAAVDTGTNTPNAAAVAGQLAFLKLAPAASAFATGREAALDRLYPMMDRLTFVLQTQRDLAGLSGDLRSRRYSLSLLRAMAAAGLNPNQPARPEVILGTLVLTGAIQSLAQECLARLAEGRAMAQTLNLPTFTAYFARLKDLVDQVMARFKLNPQSEQSVPKTEVPILGPVTEPVDRAIQMAEGYLLSDLSFRESWAVQRGLPNLPELTARAFPAGLIIERLCRYGHDLSRAVDEIYRILQASGFRYYEEDVPLPPDADDLGLLLRLFRYAAPEQQKTYRQILKTPLRRMESNILPSGEIPVWFSRPVQGSSQEQSSIFIWGNSCATTEVNLLLGLIDYDWAGFHPLIERSTLTILDRFTRLGLGATLYYIPPYILATAFELIARLFTKTLPPGLEDKVSRTLPILLTRLKAEIEREFLTPQDAALLTLACSPEQTKSLFQARWIAHLLKNQRYDGSWKDEPIFLIPGRDGTAWYSSRSVTTAFGYQALKTFTAQAAGD